MVQNRTTWFLAAVVAAGLVGMVNADEVSELRREIQQQDRILRQMQSRLTELEQKQAETPAAARPNDLRAFWSDGLRFETQDRAVQLRIGGRIHYDTLWVDGDSGIKDEEDTRDATGFRRARLYFRGDIHDDTHFRIQLDFAGSDVAFKDVFMAFRNFPLGTLRVGQFKEPFSLDELTSSNNIAFMERALAVNAFAPARNIGVMLSDSAFDRQVTWAAGVFRETASDRIADMRLDDMDGYNLTGRLTYNPIYDNDGASVLHLGTAYTYKDRDSASFGSRPEARTAGSWVGTGNIDDVSNSGIVGLEAAWVEGPFSLQGEYMKAMVSRTAGSPNVDFDGYYVQASYWLTGEHRSYNRGSGSFGFVRPNSPLGKDGGWGAWEIAGRYSHLDLNDGPVEGGKLDTYTLGLNWHLTNNTRVMWNYVYADRDKVGKANLYQMRLQTHF